MSLKKKKKPKALIKKRHTHAYVYSNIIDNC